MVGQVEAVFLGPKLIACQTEFGGHPKGIPFLEEIKNTYEVPLGSILDLYPMGDEFFLTGMMVPYPPAVGAHPDAPLRVPVQRKNGGLYGFSTVVGKGQFPPLLQILQQKALICAPDKKGVVPPWKNPVYLKVPPRFGDPLQPPILFKKNEQAFISAHQHPPGIDIEKCICRLFQGIEGLQGQRIQVEQKTPVVIASQ